MSAGFRRPQSSTCHLEVSTPPLTMKGLMREMGPIRSHAPEALNVLLNFDRKELLPPAGAFPFSNSQILGSRQGRAALEGVFDVIHPLALEVYLRTSRVNVSPSTANRRKRVLYFGGVVIDSLFKPGVLFV